MQYNHLLYAIYFNVKFESKTQATGQKPDCKENESSSSGEDTATGTPPIPESWEEREKPPPEMVEMETEPGSTPTQIDDPSPPII
ncbi:hypothetical protein DSO57_1002277 [Entomophthora muscae]|uniref:Uncharacterized protein n=1 Tax=Entomophthora muscae TaxID=34485 RepID=A0ACC2TK44_9FUNG|nr:hypothetical protein DSO57_1002277 [Entomophthora muscae]